MTQRVALIKLLRAMASGTRAQEEQTDVIFTEAAELLQWDGKMLDDAESIMKTQHQAILWASEEIAILKEGLEQIADHDPATKGLHFDNEEQLLRSAVGTARAYLRK